MGRVATEMTSELKNLYNNRRKNQPKEFHYKCCCNQEFFGRTALKQHFRDELG